MNKILKTSLIAMALLSSTAIAHADGHGNCGIEKQGRVSIVGNEFPAIQSVAAGAIACASDKVKVKANLTADHQKINVAGMSGNPAEYTSAVVANSSIVALMNEDLIRPLDDLVAKHGADIQKNQLITVNGKVMAVAFMANAQHLVYRADILKKAGVDVPKSYEEMLAAAEKIRSMGLMKNPIGGAFKGGWNLAQEFTNMFIGQGGEFFKPGTAEVTINNEKGVATLKMLKALSAYMNPDYLTHDSNATNAEYRAGNVALMNMWGSRAATLVEAEGVAKEVVDGFAIAGPLTVGGGSIPATTLWWDGWTVSKNISDADAEATFLALKHGIAPAMLNDETRSQAVWLIEGYKPTEAAKGVFAAAKAGSKPYPMVPFQGLLHSALGAEVADYLQGKEDAAKTLADVEAAYNAAAKEKGYLK